LRLATSPSRVRDRIATQGPCIDTRFASCNDNYN
jgi:hypothetical protein